MNDFQTMLDVQNDDYLKSVILRYVPLNASNLVYQNFISTIESWAGGKYPYGVLLEMILSGSSAKGTAIHGKSDVDFLISLHGSINYTLEQIYNSLYELIKSLKYQTRKQRVSIGVSFQGIDIDFVPAVKDLGNTNYHKLFINQESKRWMQTNIKQNINYVVNSNRVDEIKLLKIWRKCCSLEFPSVYLEMVVIESLKYKLYDRLSTNLMYILRFLKDKFISASFTDISNTNNRISDMLSYSEKLKVSQAAAQSINQYTKTLSWQSVVF